MRPLTAAWTTARNDLQEARKEYELGNLDVSAARALIAIGELLAGMTAHLAEDE